MAAKNGFIARIVGWNDDGTDVDTRQLPALHTFALLREWEIGAVNQGAVISAVRAAMRKQPFDEEGNPIPAPPFDGAMQTEFNAFRQLYQNATDKERFLDLAERVILLAQRKLIYDTTAKVEARFTDISNGVNI